MPSPLFLYFLNLQPTPSFPEIEPETGWGAIYCSIAWGDYDNDRDLDIAIAGNDASGMVFRVYKNNGNGAFDSTEIEPEPTEPVPTEPEPTEPVPTEPEPTETEPTEPEATKALSINTEVAIVAVALACIIGIVSFLARRK